MINIIDHCRAVYRSNKPLQKIQMRNYTPNYFMEQSPLSKDYVAPNKSGYLIKFCNGVKNLFK